MGVKTRRELTSKQDTMTTVELLKKYDEITKREGKERPLWNLLKANEKHITGLIEEDATGHWFIGAYVVKDVCGNFHTDVAILLLLHTAPLFWGLLKDGLDGESEFEKF